MRVVGDDEVAERTFYANSGYNRRINQLTCGLTQKDMLALLNKTYNNYKKKNPDPSYPTFKAMVETFATLFVQRGNAVY